MIAPPPSARLQTHLLTGQLLVTRQPQVVATVLGSCIAVTMFDRRSGLAAICHAALPMDPGPALLALPRQARSRYVAQAIPAMLAAYRRAGVSLAGLEVKLFGGADVIGHGGGGPGSRVGAANVAAARQLLAAAALTLAADNTLGHHGRKILFDTATGEVLHRLLGRLCR